MAQRRRSASPRDPKTDAGEEPPAPQPKSSLRTVFQRKCPEELALRRSMLAELVRQTSELEERRPWTGHSTSPFLDGRGSPQSARRTADGPLRFSSHFECGNLLSAKLVVNSSKGTGLGSSGGSGPGATELEYELLVDSDTQSAQGHTQWFYFSFRNGQFCGTVHFRLVNLRKKKSLYQQGMQPFVFSRKKQRGWEPFGCQGVSYGGTKKEKSEGRGDVNTLQWSYRIDRKEDEIFFAAYPPYTYSMMYSFLSSLEQNAFARRHFQRRELCRSIGQLPVPLLVIEEGVSDESEAEGQMEAKEVKEKLAIVIIARQHPGEVVGSWAVQGLLRFLLGATPAAKRLREEFVFHVIPLVNVDGVVHGNSRCTLAGVDPNRVWHDPNPILHPVVFALKNHMRSLSQGMSTAYPAKGIEMFLDLHGHSAKFGCFFYGSNPSAHISNAVFPKLCSLISTDIDFEQCHWRCPKSHRKTARYVVYKQFGVKYAYTVECSLYGPVPHESGAPLGHFTPSRVEFVGCAVGCGLAIFFNAEEDQEGQEGQEGEGQEGQGVDVGDMKLCEVCRSSDGASAAPCDLNLLLDISCPNVLAKRPWFQMERLLEITPQSVLESLALTYGEVVPDMAKLKDSDDGGDSDGDDGPEAEDDRRKETAGASSPTARKKNYKDSVKRPSGTRSAGDDEAPSPRAAESPPATSLDAETLARNRVSRARSMDRFDPLQCASGARPPIVDYSIPISSIYLSTMSTMSTFDARFASMCPRGDEALSIRNGPVISQRRDVFRERETANVANVANVAFSGGETPQGHLAVLCSSPQFCVTGVPGVGVPGVPPAAVVFDKFKTTAGTSSRHLSQELEKTRAATERSERPLRPSGLRQPGRRNSPADEEEAPLVLRPLQSMRGSSGPDPRRPVKR